MSSTCATVEHMGKYSSDPSQRARELVAAGKLGGAKYGRLGGRPRTPRASEIAAEKAMEHAGEIVAAFRDALHPSQPIQVRLKAAVEWLRIEEQGVAPEIGVRDDLLVATDEELVDFILGYLTNAHLVTSVEAKLRERGSSASWCAEDVCKYTHARAYPD
jgi:hypothetical protein